MSRNVLCFLAGAALALAGLALARDGDVPRATGQPAPAATVQGPVARPAVVHRPKPRRRASDRPGGGPVQGPSALTPATRDAPARPTAPPVTTPPPTGTQPPPAQPPPETQPQAPTTPPPGAQEPPRSFPDPDTPGGSVEGPGAGEAAG